VTEPNLCFEPYFLDNCKQWRERHDIGKLVEVQKYFSFWNVWLVVVFNVYHWNIVIVWLCASIAQSLLLVIFAIGLRRKSEPIRERHLRRRHHHPCPLFSGRCARDSSRNQVKQIRTKLDWKKYLVFFGSMYQVKMTKYFGKNNFSSHVLAHTTKYVIFKRLLKKLLFNDDDNWQNELLVISHSCLSINICKVKCKMLRN